MRLRRLSLPVVVFVSVALVLAPSPAFAVSQVRQAALTAFADFRDQVGVVLDAAVVPPDVVQTVEAALKAAHAALRAGDEPTFIAALGSFSHAVSNPNTVSLVGPSVAAGLLGGELHLIQYLAAIRVLSPEQVSYAVTPLRSVLVTILLS